MYLKRIAAVVVLTMALSGAAEGAISFIYPAAKSWVKRSDYLILKLNNPDITGVTRPAARWTCSTPSRG